MMKKIGLLFVVFCLTCTLVFSSNKVLASQPNVSDLHRDTSIKVGHEGFGDYWFVELRGEAENLAWNIVEQSGLNGTIYNAYYGNDLEALGYAFSDGFKLGLDKILKLDMFKTVNNYDELKQARKELDIIKKSVQATRDYYDYLGRNESSSIAAMKVLTFGFISNQNSLTEEDWEFIEYPFIAETKIWDLINPNNWFVHTLKRPQNDIKRQENWLMVGYGAQLKQCFIHTSICMEAPKLDPKQVSKTGKTSL